VPALESRGSVDEKREAFARFSIVLDDRNADHTYFPF